MILTKKDTFLPDKIIKDKDAFQKGIREYRGLPIQIKLLKTDRSGIVFEKGIWAGGTKGREAYILLIIGIDPDHEHDFTINVFSEADKGLKLDTESRVLEVRFGKDVPLTQEERRISIERIFGKTNR